MQDAHPDGTASVSWANGRIDTFWVDADRSLIHRAFAAVSRGSAAAVRRLDAGVADDLQHGLAHAE